MSTITFGKRIQELRLAKNISQRELARIAEMDFTYLSKIENGRMPPPKEDVIERLAKELGGDLNELMVFAGKAPAIVSQTLQRSEAAREFFFRHAPKLSDKGWDDLLRRCEEDKLK